MSFTYREWWGLILGLGVLGTFPKFFQLFAAG
jgi:hypothetical protein